MSTMADAIKRYVSSQQGKVTPKQIWAAVNSSHPDQWKESTFQAHMYACAVNQPKAYVHHASTEKFLYKHSDGTFEMYSEAMHGPNEWAPSEGQELAEVSEMVEASISLERDIEDHLVSNLESIEAGLRFVGRQVSTDVGRIDILAEDKAGNRVIIEVKVGDAKDSAIGQVMRYLGWYTRDDKRAPRAILIAGSFPDGVRYAASAIPGLKLLAYRVQFQFEQCAI